MADARLAGGMGDGERSGRVDIESIEMGMGGRGCGLVIGTSKTGMLYLFCDVRLDLTV